MEASYWQFPETLFIRHSRKPGLGCLTDGNRGRWSLKIGIFASPKMCFRLDGDELELKRGLMGR